MKGSPKPFPIRDWVSRAFPPAVSSCSKWIVAQWISTRLSTGVPLHLPVFPLSVSWHQLSARIQTLLFIVFEILAVHGHLWPHVRFSILMWLILCISGPWFSLLIYDLNSTNLSVLHGLDAPKHVFPDLWSLLLISMCLLVVICTFGVVFCGQHQNNMWNKVWAHMFKVAWSVG